MILSGTPVDRNKTPAVHIKVFYRTGAFLRPEELLTDPLPPHAIIYAWRDTTLEEIAHDLSIDYPEILPNPYIGTRLEFRHVYPAPPNPIDQPAMPGGGGSFAALPYKNVNIGSFVFGARGPGATLEDGWDGVSLNGKTLQDIRFVTGDNLVCAIVPPDEETGAVMAAKSAKVGRGKGIGEAGGGVGRGSGIAEAGGGTGFEPSSAPGRSGAGHLGRSRSSGRGFRGGPRW